jgi:hypothetical protein
MNKGLKEGDFFNPYKLFYGILIPNCISRLTTITSSAKMIWGRLAQYASENGKCYPKQETLANELGLSLSTILRGLKELEDNKFIVIVIPKGKDRLLHRNHQYGFLWHQSMCQNDNSAPSQNDNSAPSQNDNSNIIGSFVSGSCLKASPYGEGVSCDTPQLSESRIPHKKRIRLPLREPSNAKAIKRSLQANPKSLSPKVKRKRKYFQPLSVPENVQQIFDYWEGLGLQKLPSIGTRTYNECILKTKGLLDGTALGEKFTMEQIQKSILHFSLVALDPDFEPSDLVVKKTLSKKYIDNFIFNKFGSNGNSSLFRDCLTKKPAKKVVDNIITDEYPEITNKLRSYYQRQVLGGVNVKITQRDENNFRVASTRLKKFHKDNEGRFNKYMKQYDNNLAEWLWESIHEDCRGEVSKITPAWFSSEATFNRRLPAYLFRQAIIDDPSNNSHHNYLGKRNSDDLRIEY